MKKRNVVLIDSNKEFLNGLYRFLSNTNEYSVVACFDDGGDANEYLLNNIDDYDLLLMDIVLPNVDGISILENLNHYKIKKKVVVYSDYRSKHIFDKLTNLGVYYYLSKPLGFGYLLNRVDDVFCVNNNFIENSGEIQLEISKLLLNLGVPAHLRGYKYLRESILSVFGRSDLYYITKDVYPVIAEKFETTTDRVERAIRHAIETSWNRGDIKLFDDLFGYSIDYDRGKPTNYEFISTVTDRVKLNLNILN